jgi:hypothetical protein
MATSATASPFIGSRVSTTIFIFIYGLFNDIIRISGYIASNDRIYPSIHPSMALQPPFVGPWPPFQFLDLFTQSVGLPGWGISQSQGRYLQTEQRKHRINAYRHPCLEWNSNPQSQCSRWRRRFMP